MLANPRIFLSSRFDTVSESFYHYLLQIKNSIQIGENTSVAYPYINILTGNKFLKLKRKYSECFYSCFELCQTNNISKLNSMYVTCHPDDFKRKSFLIIFLSVCVNSF